MFKFSFSLLVIMASLQAFGSTKVALEELNQAQALALTKHFDEMMRHLVQALKAEPDDTLILAKALAFTKLYESQRPLKPYFSLPEQVVDGALNVERYYHMNGSTTYRLHLDFRTKHEKDFESIAILLPTQETVPLFDKSTRVDMFPSAIKPNMNVMRCYGEPRLAPYPPGLYTLNFILRNGSTFTLPLILHPNSNKATIPSLEMKKSLKSVAWTMPLSAGFASQFKRVLEVSLFETAAEPLEDRRPIIGKSVRPNTALTKGILDLSSQQNTPYYFLMGVEYLSVGKIDLNYDTFVVGVLRPKSSSHKID